MTASPSRNADLFWAIRGGGGNFGVVTSLLFRLHDVDMVTAGPMLWPLEQAADVMRFYREFILNAPEDLNGFFAMMTVPPAPPFPPPGIRVRRADAAPGAAADVRRSLSPGLQWYWKADFVTTLGDEAIAAHVEHASRLPTMHSSMHLYPIDGAVHRVGKADTAFPYRDANWAGVIVGVDPSPANKDDVVSWARGYWEATHRFGAGGAYVNFMMDEDQDRVRAAYRENYNRLVVVKSKYDPANFFRVNQNIRPAAAPAAKA